MKCIESIRNSLWQRRVAALLKEKRPVRGIGQTDIKTVILYARYESPEQFRTFNAFADDLTQRGLKVYRVVYDPRHNPPATDGHTPVPLVTDPAQRLFIITPQDLAFQRYPKSVYCQHLAGATEPSFHLFVDTSEQSHYVDTFIASLLPARLKIGFVKPLPISHSPYDLTLKPAENQRLRERLDLLLCYLNVF